MITTTAEYIKQAALSLPTFKEHPEVKREFEYSLNKRTHMWSPIIDNLLEFFEIKPSKDLYNICGAWFTLVHLSGPIDQIVDRDPMSSHWKDLGIAGGYDLVLKLKDEALQLPINNINTQDVKLQKRIYDATLSLSSAVITAALGATLDISTGMDLTFQTVHKSKKLTHLYEKLVSWKCSIIYESLFKAIAIYCNASSAKQSALKEFGHHVGFSVQMMDDIAGVWGELGDDLKKTPVKLTSVIAHGLNSDYPEKGEFGNEIIKDVKIRDINKMTQILDELDTIGFIEFIIEERKNRCIKSLNLFPEYFQTNLINWYDTYFRRSF